MGRKADLAAQLVNQLMKKIDTQFWQLREVEMTLKENSETLMYSVNKNVSSSTAENGKLEKITQEVLGLKQVVMAQNRKFCKNRKGPHIHRGKRRIKGGQILKPA